MSLRARPGPALSTSTAAALVVQVATLVEDQAALVAPACHPLGVACLHQGWTTDHLARPFLMVLMEVPMGAHMAALMVVLTVEGHMAHMVPQDHMALQVVHTVITVDLMVDPQALMVPLVLVHTMARIKDPQGDHLPTACKDLDHEGHPLPQDTCSAPCTRAAPVLPHQVMGDLLHVVPHPAWGHRQASTVPHLLGDHLHPWTPGHPHPGQTSFRDHHLMEALHLTALPLTAAPLQPLTSTLPSSHLTVHPRQQQLLHLHTMLHHHLPISTAGLLGVIIALRDHHRSQRQSLRTS